MLCDKLAVALCVIIFSVSWIRAKKLGRLEFGEMYSQEDVDPWQGDYRFSKDHLGDSQELDQDPKVNSGVKVSSTDHKPAKNSSVASWNNFITISIIYVGIVSLII